MEDGEYWRLRASEMRERASHIRDPFVSGGFLALAEQYDLLAQDGARWLQTHYLRADAGGIAATPSHGDQQR